MKIRRVLIIFSLLFLGALPAADSAHALGRTIFSPDGEAVAYLGTSVGLNIFLWEGKPVAYRKRDSVYGFNGLHLGWFEKGVIHDHDGLGVGYLEGALTIQTTVPPSRPTALPPPPRSVEEIEPVKPHFLEGWSGTPLREFLLRGNP